KTDEIAATLKEALYIAQSGRPAPVLVDIAKDAQQGSCEYQWDDSPVRLPGYRPDLRALPEEFERAVELINAAKKPMILAGHGVLMSGASQVLLDFVEKTRIPVAMTLLGLSGFPASHPLSLGMMGMHGESWVNTAIQEADLLLALGTRFDDRVTGNLKTYAVNARKIHVEIDPSEINKNIRVDVGIVGDLRETLRTFLAGTPPLEHAAWLEHINDLKGDSAVRDIQNLPDSGHLYAAHVIHDLWRYTGGA